VDEVPSVLYFHLSQALHGAFWHDHFGTPGSHGCVNLSIVDAKWVFDWAPPELKEGWRAVRKTPAALWVQVEKAKPGQVPSEPQAHLD